MCLSSYSLIVMSSSIVLHCSTESEAFLSSDESVYQSMSNYLNPHPTNNCTALTTNMHCTIWPIIEFTFTGSLSLSSQFSFWVLVNGCSVSVYLLVEVERPGGPAG